MRSPCPLIDSTTAPFEFVKSQVVQREADFAVAKKKTTLITSFLSSKAKQKRILTKLKVISQQDIFAFGFALNGSLRLRSIAFGTMSLF